VDNTRAAVEELRRLLNTVTRARSLEDEAKALVAVHRYLTSRPNAATTQIGLRKQEVLAELHDEGRGMSLAEVGQVVGLSRGRVHNIIAGHVTPTRFGGPKSDPVADAVDG
jgi:hypothetical protein